VVSGSDGSALRRARLLRGWTLEEAAGRLNAVTGGATDASLFSAWESGRKRTGLRNRAALARLFHERTEVLFAHQDGMAPSVLEESGTSVVVGMLTRWAELVEAMTEVVTTAEEWLVATGSRSREKAYLAAIETAVAHSPDLVYYRILYGLPRHRELTDHLLRLLELRSPRERRNGVATLRIGAVEQESAMERFFVASERLAVVPLPSFHGSEGFDCGIMLARDAAVGLAQHGKEVCASARAVETADTVLALSRRSAIRGG